MSILMISRARNITSRDVFERWVRLSDSQAEQPYTGRSCKGTWKKRRAHAEKYIVLREKNDLLFSFEVNKYFLNNNPRIRSSQI